jgi:hypothetical protein
MKVLIKDFKPVEIGDFGNGHPLTKLATIQDFMSWYHQYFPTEVNPLTQYQTPILVSQVDTNEGGIFHFKGGEGESDPTLFKYRITIQDANKGEWSTCTSFRIVIPNDTILIGGVEVKRVGTTKLESPVLTNNSPYSFYAYPIVIKSWYWEGVVFHATIQSAYQNYIRIETNGFGHEFMNPAFSPGEIRAVSFDFTGYSGQFQGINYYCQDPDYRTPTISTIVPQL